MTLTQGLRRRDFELQLAIDLVEIDRRSRARSETAIRIERDAPGVDMLERALDTADDRLHRIDRAGCHADATEPDLHVLAEIAQHRHIAGARGRELDGEVADLQAVDLLDDGLVAAAVIAFAPRARRRVCTDEARSSGLSGHRPRH